MTCCVSILIEVDLFFLDILLKSVNNSPFKKTKPGCALDLATLSFSGLFILNAIPQIRRLMMLRKLMLVISIALFFTAGIYAQGGSTTAAPAASTSDTAKKPAVFRPTKDQIKQVQTILKDKKLYTGDASGTYNDDTRSGIKSFQKDNGLKETGTLNRATLEKFGVALTDAQKAIPVSPGSIATATSDKPTSAPSLVGHTTVSNPSATGAPTKPAPFRASLDQVKAAQKILIDGKMYSGEQSGKLDDGTRDGLKKYQEANKIKVTGTLNAATLDKMGIALTDAQKANVAAQAAYDAAKAKN